MARIAGVDIPNNKQVWVSLQYIYGIGRTLSQKIIAQTDIRPETKVSDLTEEEVIRLREITEDSEPGPMPAPGAVSARQWLEEDSGAAWLRNK